MWINFLNCAKLNFSELNAKEVQLYCLYTAQLNWKAFPPGLEPMKHENWQLYMTISILFFCHQGYREKIRNQTDISKDWWVISGLYCSWPSKQRTERGEKIKIKNKMVILQIKNILKYYPYFSLILSYESIFKSQYMWHFTDTLNI